MENKVIKTRNAMIWMDEQGICHESYTEGTRLTIEDAREQIQIISEISGHKKVPLLVDLNNIIHVPRECRTYYAGKEGEKIVKVTALLVGTQMSRVIGYFFIRLSKPVTPVKLFTSEKDALKWLKEYVN